MNIEVYTYWDEKLAVSHVETAEKLTGIPVFPDWPKIEEPFAIFPWLKQPKKIGYRANNIDSSEITSHIQNAVDLIITLQDNNDSFRFHKVSIEGTDDEVLHFETGRALEDSVEDSRLIYGPHHRESEYILVGDSKALDRRLNDFTFELRAENTIKFSEYADFDLQRLRENAEKTRHGKSSFDSVRSKLDLLAYLAGEARSDKLVSSTSIHGSFPDSEPVYHEGLAFGFYLNPAAMFYIDQLEKGAESAEDIAKNFDKKYAYKKVAEYSGALRPSSIHVSTLYKNRIESHLRNLSRFHVIDTVETTTYVPNDGVYAV